MTAVSFSTISSPTQQITSTTSDGPSPAVTAKELTNPRNTFGRSGVALVDGMSNPTTSVTNAFLPNVNLTRRSSIKALQTPASKLLAEWQGRVVAIHESYFVAEVTGLVGEGVEGCLEEAHIPISDVAENDKPLFKEGAFFRLCVNFVTRPRPGRFTSVVFRRLPAYQSHELDAADERANQLSKQLRVE